MANLLLSRPVMAFLELLRAGLWGFEPRLDSSLTLDEWREVHCLSMEQGVVALLADGITHLPQNSKPEREFFISMLMQIKRIEDDNDRCLAMAIRLQKYLKNRGVDTIVLKGIGMACNYPNPRHRMVGDIDLLTDMTAEAFEKGREELKKIDKNEFDLNVVRRHAAYNIHGQMVELHASISGGCNAHCDRAMAAWSKKSLQGQRRMLHTGRGSVSFPPVQFDSLYVFIHFFRHYISAACGLRQLCDWVMFINRYSEKIDHATLERDLRTMSLWRVWQIFSSVAALYLGLPKEKMPLYDGSGDHLAAAVVRSMIYSCHVLDKVHSDYDKNRHPFVQHLKSFTKLLPVYLSNCRLFPQETFYVVTRYIASVLKDLLLSHIPAK